MTATKDHTCTAAGLIFTYAMIIGFTDNYVRVTSPRPGLAIPLHPHLHGDDLAGGAGAGVRAAAASGSICAVLARSTIHGLAMVIYSGPWRFCSMVSGGCGPVHRTDLRAADLALCLWPSHWPVWIIAVAVGFVGVILVLGPEAMSGASLAAMLPVIAGAMYAMGGHCHPRMVPRGKRRNTARRVFSGAGGDRGHRHGGAGAVADRGCPRAQMASCTVAPSGPRGVLFLDLRAGGGLAWALA